jgi:hypothetical protein
VTFKRKLWSKLWGWSQVFVMETAFYLKLAYFRKDSLCVIIVSIQCISVKRCWIDVNEMVILRWLDRCSLTLARPVSPPPLLKKTIVMAFSGCQLGCQHVMLLALTQQYFLCRHSFLFIFYIWKVYMHICVITVNIVYPVTWGFMSSTVLHVRESNIVSTVMHLNLTHCILFNANSVTT